MQEIIQKPYTYLCNKLEKHTVIKFNLQNHSMSLDLLKTLLVTVTQRSMTIHTVQQQHHSFYCLSQHS